jgi:hypothetical protein
MNYKVIYEVSGVKITLGKYKTKKAAEKKVSTEKLKDNFGSNGYREYVYIKYC